MTFTLRNLYEADILQVSEIEREAFPTIWPRTSFKRDLTNRRISYLVAALLHPPEAVEEPEEEPIHPFLGREPIPLRLIRNFRDRLWPQGVPHKPTNDTPLGFVSVWFITEEAHITAIAVKEAWRGQGLGELLLIGAIETAMHRKSRVVTLEVRVSNVSAISLYEKYSFKRVGTRKGYYTDNRESAGIMTTEPIHCLSYQQRFSELREAYLKRRGSVEMSLKLASA